MPNNVLADRVGVTSTTTGTGTYSLGSAIAGYLDFALAGVTTGSRVPYLAIDNLTTPGTWEIGEGIWTSGAPSTLTRALIRRNSSGGTTAINWSAGTRYVFLAPAAGRLLYKDDAGHLPLGAARLTGMAAATATDDAARFDQVAWQRVSETLVSSAVGSVVFTMNSTNYVRMRVEYQDVVASAAVGLYARVSVDNAVSYLTAATDYHRTIHYSGGASGTTVFSQGGQSSIIDLTSAVATTAGVFGDLDIQIGGGRHMQGRASYFDSAANHRQVASAAVVLGGASATITHVLVAFNGGNINSGRFRLLGAR